MELCAPLNYGFLVPAESTNLQILFSKTTQDFSEYAALESPPGGCSVLQCVAVCCSVLQCVAVCCSVLQGVECAASVSLPFCMCSSTQMSKKKHTQKERDTKDTTVLFYKGDATELP